MRENTTKFQRRVSRLVSKTIRSMVTLTGTTPLCILRKAVPKRIFRPYVAKVLSLQGCGRGSSEECRLVANYLVANWATWRSAERKISDMFDTSGMPLDEEMSTGQRLPNLQVDRVSIIFGDENLDWVSKRGGMDAALKAQRTCDQRRMENKNASTRENTEMRSDPISIPTVDIHSIKGSRHMLCLHKPDEFINVMTSFGPYGSR